MSELATSYDPAIHRWPHFVHADQLQPAVVNYLFEQSDVMLELLEQRDRVKMRPKEPNQYPYSLGYEIGAYGTRLQLLRSLESCIALLHFQEASTRTATSFSTAAARLGAQTFLIQDVGRAEDSLTSRRKGETLRMTLEMYLQYHADALIMRSPNVADPYLAAQLFEDYTGEHWPDHDKRWGVVINAGNGDDQHPTQALLDLFSIRKVAGSLSDLTILFAGDVGRARAVNSLLIALANCGQNITVKLAVPVIGDYRLVPPQPTLDRLTQAGVNYELVDVPDRATFVSLAQAVDVAYYTRLQAERYGAELAPDFATQNAAIILLNEELMAAAPNLYVFHPLPLKEEVAEGMEQHQRALFRRQAGWGVPVRMALLYSCILYPEELKRLAYGSVG